MPYDLPPLKSLRLFEAAGRRLSFKRAAEELYLTPSAVSHGIKGLEDWLGTPLFVRGLRSITLTQAGAGYLTEIREALQRIDQASRAVAERADGCTVALSVAPTFGLRWLVPHLPGFIQRHAGIDVTVDTAHEPVALSDGGVDFAIRMGRGRWPGLTVTHLTGEQLVPVCAPMLAAAVTSPRDLPGQTLLHVSTVSEDWAAWAALAGVDGLPLDRGLRFDTIYLALEAAAQGFGIAMGRLPLIQPDLAAGRLVPVLGPPRPCRTGYWLVSATDTPQRPAAAAFRHWLCTGLRFDPPTPGR